MAAPRTSQNGWSVHPTSAGCVSLSWITGRVDPRVHDLFDRFCKRFNAEVESITRAHSWGYANREIRGSSQISNHASGTAIDLNAPAHPLGKSGTFTSAQVRAIKRILADFPQLRWGGNYSGRKDEMHFELNVKPEAFNVTARMISPLEGRYTSKFDPNRRIVYNGKWINSPHGGADIAPPVPGTVGLAVRAAFAGTVKKAVSWAKAGNTSSTWAPGRTGNGVLIANPDGEGQGYNHMDPTVKVGDRVAAGDIIGHLDRSGRQTGTHLHFETWANWRNPDSAFDPMVLFRKYNVSIGSAPKISGGGSPSPTPTPSKEWFDMADKDDLKKALREVLTEDWISVGGATGKRYGDGQAAPYSLMRDGGYSLDELRDLPTRKFPVHGSLKGESGADDMTLLNMWRRAAGSQADLRRYYPRIMAELGAIQANLAGDVTAAEVARELAPLLLDDLSASITDAIAARQDATPEQIAEAVITEITARLED